MVHKDTQTQHHNTIVCKTLLVDGQNVSGGAAGEFDTLNVGGGALAGAATIKGGGSDVLTLLASDDSVLLTVDAQGDLGIGATPLSRLHVSIGDSGASASEGILTIENSNDSILQFLSANNRRARIYFGDPESASIGQIIYQHSLDELYFQAGGSEIMRLTGGGMVGINTDDPSTTLHARSGSSGVTTFSPSTMALLENSGSLHLTFAIPNDESAGLRFADSESFNSGGMTYFHATDLLEFNAGSAPRLRFGASSFEIYDGVDMRDVINMFRQLDTTERELGQLHADGNVIKRKTIAVATGPAMGGTDYAHSITNLGSVLRVEGAIDDGTDHLPIGHSDVHASVTSTNVRLNSSISRTTFTGEIVIYYTTTA